MILCFRYTYGKPLPPQSFPILLNGQTVQIHLNEEGCSDFLPLPDMSIKADFCIIDHFEMIDLKTEYPTHQQIFSLQDIKSYPLDENKNIKVIITVLPPPIVVNINHFDSKFSKETCLLNAQQLQYFKDNGNNALIFVHGYNLLLGECGCYPEGYEIQPNMGISEYHLKDNLEQSKNASLTFKKSSYSRTIAWDFNTEEILTHFPNLSLYFKSRLSAISHNPKNNPEGFGLTEALLNGTDATHWFTHMEYNLNRAAGFSGKNYEQYTRILNIHWPSGNGITEFRLAEKLAEESAFHFMHIIKQLIESNIQIHIVAHSLGCRLVLQALKLFNESLKTYSKSQSSIIEQLLLWQAAIPQTALCEQKSEFNIKETYSLIKKITVLYSKKDTVLQTLYSSSGVHKLSIKKALGYAGPEASPWIQALQKAKQLISVDQTSHLLGHSFMKIPTISYMQDIYQEYIVGGKHGIQTFGRYQI